MHLDGFFCCCCCFFVFFVFLFVCFFFFFVVFFSKLLRDFVIKYVSTYTKGTFKKDQLMTYLMVIMRCVLFLFFPDFLSKSICCRY